MRYQVPQFIEVEDKIFESLTFKQFLYVAGGAGVVAIMYRFLGFFGIILALPFVGFALALAFYRMNGKPFMFTVEAAFNYLIRNKLYLWRKQQMPIQPLENKAVSPEPLLYVPKVAHDKLKDMTWNLGVREGAEPGAVETMKKGAS